MKQTTDRNPSEAFSQDLLERRSSFKIHLTLRMTFTGKMDESDESCVQQFSRYQKQTKLDLHRETLTTNFLLLHSDLLDLI